MPPDPFDIRTGAAYEADRPARLSSLAEAAGGLRVDLADDLVLVFATRETLAAALAELLRAERVGDGEGDRMAAENAAFAALAPGRTRLAATFIVDVADPVALGDRLVEIRGVAQSVAIEVGGVRVAAAGSPSDDGTGACHLLFEPPPPLRSALLGGATLAVVVDHPACRARVALSAEQVRAVAADLRD